MAAAATDEGVEEEAGFNPFLDGHASRAQQPQAGPNPFIEDAAEEGGSET